MKIALIGECMVELSLQESGLYHLGFGGDTLNTAIYLVRNGIAGDYFTVLGDDNYSDYMLSAWRSEGVGVEHVKTKVGGMPGLYIIENDDSGERTFNYWRDNAAAKTLIIDYPEIFDDLQAYDYIFISGISLSLYSAMDLTVLFTFFANFRADGGKVVFDNNYRERNWSSSDHAISVFSKMMKLTDIALISFDDELSLYGPHTVDDCSQRFSDSGVKEVIIKNGHQGCLVNIQGNTKNIPLTSVLKPIDTTAAGDSFNGAYLAAKISGASVNECVEAGQVCAGNVIMHKGAIIDKRINLREAFQQ